MLTLDGCRSRRERLLRLMEANRWDLFLTGNYRTAYYFSGVLGPAEQPAIFALWQDGAGFAITPASGDAGSLEVIPLETYSIHRTITHPWHDAAALLRKALVRRSPAKTCGLERAAVSGLFQECLGGADIQDATDTVLSLRKRKEEDEIEEIRASLRYCALAYHAAKETIAPGLTEIDVYNAMYAAIVRAAGTAIPFPGDFACGERCIKGGGPPTPRIIQRGDLYILDLFPEPALYFGDTSRTFVVGEATDRQHLAWEAVLQAVRIGEAAVKPGVRARDVYAAVKEFLDSQEVSEKSFWHHAGHGIGHRGHEAPRIIPGTDDIFEIGDVITLEPGVYSEALHGGIRLEDNYVVRENGLENLFDFPMDL